MDQPAHRRLRPAGRSGLTSPDPVSTLHPPQGRHHRPRPGNPDKPQNSKRQENHAPNHGLNQITGDSGTRYQSVDRG
jgi:hypothetical protein